MKEDINTILNSIENRINKERGYLNYSVARSLLQVEGMEKFYVVWINQREYRSESGRRIDMTGQTVGTIDTGKKDTLKEGFYTSKNSALGQYIIEKKESFSYISPAYGYKKYHLLNWSKYNSRDINNDLQLHIDLLEGKKEIIFKTIAEGRKTVEKLSNLLTKTEEEISSMQKKLIDFSVEKEKNISEIEKQIATLEQQREEYHNELLHEIEKYKQSYSFIRKQASLRLNPILDEIQNKAKRKHLYDGCTVVIDGGPGTGKTTTLIQRLRLLIDLEGLLDLELNGEIFKLRDDLKELIVNPVKNWIFFSPTDSLRIYLKNNMNAEGLLDTDNKTKVWSTYLKTIIRDNYQLAGTDSPFVFNRKLNDCNLFQGDQLRIIRSFQKYYIDSIKSKIQQVSEIDCRKFSWKIAGLSITKKCKEIDSVHDIKSLIKLLMNLAEIKEHPELHIQEIFRQYQEEIRQLTGNFVVKIKKDQTLYDSILKLLASWEDNKEEMEDDLDEEIEEIMDYSIELKLNGYIRRLLKNIALSLYNDKLVLRGRLKDLYSLLTTYIEKENLSKVGELAYFVQYVYPVLRGFDTILFSRIPQIYKSFRREILKRGTSTWNNHVLRNIIEKSKNRDLHPQEQSLLIGFINNLIHIIYKQSKPTFNGLKHKYVEAYKDCCRLVIGVDEATDYTVVDYYAMYSLRHYLYSSITLSGDIMQGLNRYGIEDWMCLENTLIFPKVEIIELRTSYRQSPNLLSLASFLYKESLHKDPMYKCYLSDLKHTPKPLLFESDDEEEKAKWIAQRIIEVKKSYGFVPSIAIFFTEKEDIPRFKILLEESDDFESEGIDVINCENGLIDPEKDSIRLFPLNLVKGMEFEVVFFHDVHKIENIDLIDKYLYVGLSRATFYMGITINKGQSIFSEEMRKLFGEKTIWK